MDECINLLLDENIFSTLYANNGYHQTKSAIRIAIEPRPLSYLNTAYFSSWNWFRIEGRVLYI